MSNFSQLSSDHTLRGAVTRIVDAVTKKHGGPVSCPHCRITDYLSLLFTVNDSAEVAIHDTQELIIFCLTQCITDTICIGPEHDKQTVTDVQKWRDYVVRELDRGVGHIIAGTYYSDDKSSPPPLGEDVEITNSGLPSWWPKQDIGPTSGPKQDPARDDPAGDDGSTPTTG